MKTNNTKKEKSHVRDTWIPESWRYNGGGFHKNQKKYDRKRDKKKVEKEAM